jgi:Tfp pilus assembly protein PilV
MERRRADLAPASADAGLTLVELMVGAAILVIGIVALLGAFLSQITLNEHSRNLTMAINDANRVMERMRQQNTSGACLAPSVAAPAGFATWDAWLADMGAAGGGGKSVQPTPAVNELVVISNTGSDPIQVTVSICWRQRERVLGECTWNGAALVPGDTNGDGIITAPATLSTLLSCRR